MIFGVRRAGWIVIASLPAAGCGRFDFDPRAGDAGPDSSIDGGKCAIATPFQPPVLVQGLDTGTGDVTLRLEANELTGVFWSLRTGDADIFLAQRPDFATPFTASLLTPLNSAGNVDADPSISPDGAFIAFSSNRPTGLGGFDLYESDRSGGVYGTPMPITAVNTAMNETTPTYSPADGAMYFDALVSNQSKIFRTFRTAPFTYSAPQQVTELSSADEEFDIAPSTDGLAVYFRSSRPGGPGGGDIYVATRPALGQPFGTPTLVPEVSDVTIDGPSFLSPDQCRLYFTSDRSGSVRLYVASR
jgi:Tol biopolymer transport system component